MAGYDGYSMSNNARLAYQSGERPLSKWNKDAFLGEVADLEGEIYEKVKNTPLYILKEFLDYSAWHHTSKHYNITRFYNFNLESFVSATEEEINTLKEKRKQYLAETKDERELKKKEAEKKRAEKKAKKELDEKIISYLPFTHYKTEASILRAYEAGRITLESLKESKRLKELKKELTPLLRLTKYKTIIGFVIAVDKGVVTKEEVEELKTKRKLKKLMWLTDYKNLEDLFSAYKNKEITIAELEEKKQEGRKKEF